MHRRGGSQKKNYFGRTFQVSVIFSFIVLFMFGSSQDATAVTEVQIFDVAPMYVNCSGQPIGVLSFKLYNETNNNLTNMIVTLTNVTSFDPNNQLGNLSPNPTSGLALYNETDGVPGFQNSDTFLEYTAGSWTGGPVTWTTTLSNNTTSYAIPTTEPSMPNLHLVIRMSGLCQDGDEFNMSIQANDIVTTFGSVPAAAVWSKDIIVDIAPPHTEISIAGPQAGSSPTRISQLTSFNLTSNDNASGISYILHKIDTVDWTPYAGNFSISTPGHHNISYRGADNIGYLESEKTLWVYVNSQPDITTVPVETAKVNVQYVYDVDATDLDASDALTFSLQNTTEGIEIDPLTGIITWTPTSDQVGEHIITVVVSDGLESYTQVFDVTVIAPESAAGISPVTIAIVSVVVAAGVLGGLAAGTEFGKFKFILFFLPLYTRLKKEKVLDHFTRGRIFGYIQANPGEHLNAIKRALEINNGAIVYHLNTLEKMGYIKSKIDRSYKRFYPATVKIPDKNIGELTQIQKDIVKVIKNSPGTSQKDIAIEMDISKQLVSYHIKILVEAGFVVMKSEGKSTCHYIADDLKI